VNGVGRNMLGTMLMELRAELVLDESADIMVAAE
jgi:hypothetical protein